MFRRLSKAVLVVIFLMSVAGTATTARAASFTIDSSFISNALQSVQQIEPGFIPGNDCSHWISSFLESDYNMPSSLGSAWTDNLINNLINDGDTSVITGDGHYDSGAFIPASQASSNLANLDAQTLEQGGSGEFIIAYKWAMNPPATSALADHLAVYVGGGNVVSHGILDQNSNEWNMQKQQWNAFNNMGTVAIIQLTNSQPTPTPSTTPLPTNEAGHVLEVTQTTSILDANGNPTSSRCNGPSDSNSNAVLPQQWDVVADTNTTIDPNGTSLLQVMYPDNCQPGLDFSSNQDIANGSGAVGYVAWSALSEVDAVQSNPQSSSGTAWRDCWDPTQCGDQTYPNNADTLSAKDHPYLFAWWNGQMWDPHWWHAVDNQGNDCAVYGRDWTALMVYG